MEVDFRESQGASLSISVPASVSTDQSIPMVVDP